MEDLIHYYERNKRSFEIMISEKQLLNRIIDLVAEKFGEGGEPSLEDQVRLRTLLEVLDRKLTVEEKNIIRKVQASRFDDDDYDPEETFDFLDEIAIAAIASFSDEGDFVSDADFHDAPYIGDGESGGAGASGAWETEETEPEAIEITPEKATIHPSVNTIGGGDVGSNDSESTPVETPSTGGSDDSYSSDD